jgi:hypothetical protein
MSFGRAGNLKRICVRIPLIEKGGSNENKILAGGKYL